MELVKINDTLELTQEQYNYILNHIQYDKVKKLVTKEVIDRENDFDALLEEYLSNLKDGTRKSYESYLKLYLKQFSPALITRKEADDFTINLSKTYASNSVRIITSAISSFHKKLVRWDVLEYNVWDGVDSPKVEKAKDLVVPNEDEVECIYEHFHSIAMQKAKNMNHESQIHSARKMCVALTLLIHNGFRVGAIENLKLVGQQYITFSKGKEIKGTITSKLFDVLNEFNLDYSVLQDLNKPMIQFNLTKAMKKLAKEGKIKTVYHAHSFRHFYAVKMYKYTGSVYKVSRLLNHAGISVTEKYLRSLDVEVEELK